MKKNPKFLRISEAENVSRTGIPPLSVPDLRPQFRGSESVCSEQFCLRFLCKVYLVRKLSLTLVRYDCSLQKWELFLIIFDQEGNSPELKSKLKGNEVDLAAILYFGTPRVWRETKWWHHTPLRLFWRKFWSESSSKHIWKRNFQFVRLNLRGTVARKVRLCLLHWETVNFTTFGLICFSCPWIFALKFAFLYANTFCRKNQWWFPLANQCFLKKVSLNVSLTLFILTCFVFKRFWDKLSIC